MNIDSIEHKLRQLGNPDAAAQQKKYHKSHLEFLGLSIPQLRREVSPILAEIKDSREFFITCAGLWSREIYDLRQMTIFMLAKRLKYFDPQEDFPRFYKWFCDCDGWALNDSLAIPVFGEFLLRFPQFRSEVDGWRSDSHLWVRRAGILRFITPVRHRLPWPEDMENILQFHLSETDFFIRKALGWTLREWSSLEPEKVSTFCHRNETIISGLTRREALRNIRL